jgi:hypothetical protein
MAYFEHFPTATYDPTGNNTTKDIRDILRRVTFNKSITSNHALFSMYDIKEGETPEMIAHKEYGDPNLHWVILLFNGIINVHAEWPRSQRELIAYVNDKYDNPNATHHWELPQSSGTETRVIKIKKYVYPAIEVTNYEHEEQLQNEKKQIKLPMKEHVPAIVREFKLEVRS